MTNSDDISFLTRPLIDAYLETCVALIVLRIPEVQDLVSASLPEAVVSTSYAADHENLIINVRGMFESMRAEGLGNVGTLQHSFRQTNCIFLGAMWDTLKQHRRFGEIKTEPVVEFLRHVRNASSHGGRLNFGEPLSANVRETRSTQRIRVGRRQRNRTCWDCEREWKRMVVPLEPGRPSEARQLLRTQR